MKFNTADLCDQYRDEVQVLQNGFSSYGKDKKIFGQIVTIKLDEDNSGLITLLKGVGEDRVVVVDVDASYCAVVGDTLMGYAHKHNWAGIIVNGYVRDTHETKKIEVGLWALGTCPMKSAKKSPSSQGCELNFGGVTFVEGNYLYADYDGIVVMKENVLV
jgi:regulator of ribonuclease activity A